MKSKSNQPPERAQAQKSGAPKRHPTDSLLELPHNLRVYRDAFRDLDDPNINEERLAFCLELFDTPAGQRVFEIYSSVRASEERHAQMVCADAVTDLISYPQTSPDMNKARILTRPSHKPQLVGETDQVELRRIDEFRDDAQPGVQRSFAAFEFSRIQGQARMAPAAQLREMMIVLTQGEVEFRIGGLAQAVRIKASAGEVAILHLISDIKGADWTPAVMMSPIGGPAAGFLLATARKGVAVEAKADGSHHFVSTLADREDEFWESMERLHGERSPITFCFGEKDASSLDWKFEEENSSDHPHLSSLKGGDFQLGICRRWLNSVERVWRNSGGRSLNIGLLRSNRPASRDSKLSGHFGLEFILALRGEMNVLLANNHGGQHSKVAFGDVEHRHRRVVKLSAEPREGAETSPALMLSSCYEHGFAAQSKDAVALWIGVRTLNVSNDEEMSEDEDAEEPQVGRGLPSSGT